MFKKGLLGAVVALAVIASASSASIVDFQVAADGDPVITCVATWNSTTNTQAIDGVHKLWAPGHVLSAEDGFTASSADDPTINIMNQMENDTGSAWTGYSIKVGIRAKNAGTALSALSLSAIVDTPSDWTANIVQDLTYTPSYTDADGRVLEGYYIALIDYSDPTVVPDGGSVDLGYTLSFKGATSYLFWQETTPVPEPTTLVLFGAGALLALRRRNERRFAGAFEAGENNGVAVVVCTWQDRPKAEKRDMSSLTAK